MNLAIKSLLGLMLPAVLMCLAIFLPAGATRYEEAWRYFLICFGGFVFITIYLFINDRSLLQSRLKAGAIAEKRPFQKWVQGFAFIGFLGMYVLAGQVTFLFQVINAPYGIIVAAFTKTVLCKPAQLLTHLSPITYSLKNRPMTLPRSWVVFMAKV